MSEMSVAEVLTRGVWHVTVVLLDDPAEDHAYFESVQIETRGQELALLTVAPDDRRDIDESLGLLGSAEITYRALRIFRVQPQLPCFLGTEFSLDVSDEQGRTCMLLIEPE